MKIKLYHGTSSEKADKITEEGAERLYLTMDSDQAEYYAECASEDDESDPEILVIEVSTNTLMADLPSFNEPLTFILEKNNLSSEEDWHNAIENDEIPYPEKDDWKTSLKYTGSVFTVSRIEPEQIIRDGDLYDEDLQHIENLIREESIKPPKMR